MYLVFIALQCIGPVVGLFLNRPSKVQRKDGKKVVLAILENPMFEIKETTRLFFTKRFLLIVLWIGQAVFAEAVFFTYLARKLLHRFTPHFESPSLTCRQCGSRSAHAPWDHSSPASLLWFAAISWASTLTALRSLCVSAHAVPSGSSPFYKARGGSGPRSL